jgi:predicted deacylase
MDLVSAARQYFAPDYRAAREQFARACEHVGVAVHEYANPLQGPHGEILATDAAWVGPADAPRVVVLVSATHGVEGFPGSAAQADWLFNAGHGALGEGVSVLLVHAINPYGFAWQRRVTEEGVDLNRNFIDFSKPRPGNPGYELLADALVPASLDAETLRAADARIEAYRREHGDKGLMLARSGGQYVDPRGVFYGGDGPTWSRRTLERIARDHALAERELVAVVDFHTGLGPFGHGEPICAHTVNTVNVERAYRWYGRSVTQPALGTSASVEKTGLASTAGRRCWASA